MIGLLIKYILLYHVFLYLCKYNHFATKLLTELNIEENTFTTLFHRPLEGRRKRCIVWNDLLI